MNDLSRLLSRTRAVLNKSLRKIGGSQFHTNLLGRYERGEALPPSSRLEDLAACYELDVEEVRAAYLSASAQTLPGAIRKDDFVHIVRSINKGDHAVVTAQDSLMLESPEFADIVAGVLQRGARYTWVAYLPKDETFNYETSEWQSNHRQAAHILLKGLRGRGISPEDAQLDYLFIGNPTMNDTRYLRKDEGVVYICRGNASDYHESQAWLQAKAEDDQRWWLPLHKGYILLLQDWLVERCGLALPGRSKTTVPDAKERQLRRVPLEDFLA